MNADQIAGYDIIARIGRGAMGAIYKARQISLDRIVALKVLAPDRESEARLRDRLMREARAVARLNHPNIVGGIDVGESNGVVYFAMEYVDGPTVGELLRRGGALDERRAIDIVRQVARALDHAFTNGVIHRDVKPDNIMIAPGGVAKLCDLGLAKIASKDATGTRASMGTPHYISPEQVRGEPDVDTRSDIYSLGASFYHMATGSVPFAGGSPAAVMARHVSETPVQPRRRNPRLSPAVDRIIMKMMHKARQDRHQTPAEVVRDLEAVDARGVPQTALRVIAASKLRRFRMLRLAGRR